jgi:GNAT superfamily N-acetyltransferase
MVEVEIAEVPRNQLPLLVDLYNQIFRPVRPVAEFERRFLGRHNILQLVAKEAGRPVGLFLGFELKPDTFFAWYYGVVPDCRRKGTGSQLMEAAERWATEKGYEHIRLECYNHQRPMLHLAIQLNYDIVGLRWDADRSANLVICEKSLLQN